jgi:hypothetical protein
VLEAAADADDQAPAGLRVALAAPWLPWSERLGVKLRSPGNAASDIPSTVGSWRVELLTLGTWVGHREIVTWESSSGTFLERAC